ncbi:hypothetical protein IVG45_20195 [Methylomonas sp. LL1]|uniref:hypothetical protein n=1 Tax=Methylomonas sp. LL1 TaxID=2785785 RepID=UPI0018C37793|nr:hypothetical protein [Methylomonas sp. LL1]QPK63099.1 hypothetical protein IVG45_20195 [Methylomonas sp. LL1]CAG1022490.1 hypothetical protein MTYM_01769 [Methylococcales bacterium]
MKKTQLNQGILGGLLLIASAVNAQDYPAADFQPKVIFRDESVIESDAKSASVPCVNKEAESKSEQVVAEVDAKYPASSFQPKVIFSEAN